MNKTAEAIRELMETWEILTEAVEHLFPTATREEVYEAVAHRMDDEIHRMRGEAS